MELGIYYLLIVNILAMFLYAIDKLKAIKGKKRIRERDLLLCSLFGGGFGSLVGMFFFHHKTKKVYFYLWNITFLIVWIYLIIKMEV